MILLNNQRGMSALMAILIISTLMAAILYSGIRLNYGVQTSIQNFQATYWLDHMAEDIKLTLSDLGSCNRSFTNGGGGPVVAIANISGAAAENSVTNIRRADGTVLYQVGELYAEGLLRFSSIILDRWEYFYGSDTCDAGATCFPNPPRRGRLRLRLGFNRSQDLSPNPKFWREFYLDGQADAPAINLNACKASPRTTKACAWINATPSVPATVPPTMIATCPAGQTIYGKHIRQNPGSLSNIAVNTHASVGTDRNILSVQNDQLGTVRAYCCGEE